MGSRFIPQLANGFRHGIELLEQSGEGSMIAGAPVNIQEKAGRLDILSVSLQMLFKHATSFFDLSGVEIAQRLFYCSGAFAVSATRQGLMDS